MKLSAIALAVSLALAGCVTHSTTDAVTRATKDDAAAMKITSVTARTLDDRETAETSRIAGIIQSHLSACASGERPTEVALTIRNYEGQNAAKTILLGDSGNLSGRAQFIDVESKEVKADYDFARTISGGGIIAAAAMSDTLRDLGGAVADDLCEDVFGVTPPKSGAPAGRPPSPH